MAERRMFHATVVESDQFLDLPLSTQALYFHLGMHTDDDGFVNNARRITRSLGAKPSDLKRLEEGGFLMQFADVVVLTHHRMGNTLRADRLHTLRYPEIAENLFLTPGRVYSKDPTAGRNLLELRSPKNPPLGFPNITQPNITQENITQENITQDKVGGLTLTHLQTESLLEQMGLEQFAQYAHKLDALLAQGNIVEDHYATILRWWEEDRSV